MGTLELAEGVYFQDFAPMVFQALRQTVYHVPFPQYLRSLMGAGGTQMEDYIEQMVGNFSEGGSGNAALPLLPFSPRPPPSRLPPCFLRTCARSASAA